MRFVCECDIARVLRPLTAFRPSSQRHNHFNLTHNFLHLNCIQIKRKLSSRSLILPVFSTHTHTLSLCTSFQSKACNQPNEHFIFLLIALIYLNSFVYLLISGMRRFAVYSSYLFFFCFYIVNETLVIVQFVCGIVHFMETLLISNHAKYRIPSKL